MPDTDSNKSQVKFKIFMYRDSLIRGLAVAISVEYNEISTLSCENKTLSFKNISPPDNISDTKSDIIFFQSKVPGHNKMQFESSSYEGHFLACVKENDLFKLTLKKKGDCKDKSVMFTVEAN
ncbi:Interleukin-18 [Tupaia chinensis]|uniref:Interleukin-18 n=2 Tax=Tupaia chinensis TaxID=246437 RepID=L9KNC4_TUPCH|nr:Interleukin-18 [Tupaia chinensis]